MSSSEQSSANGGVFKISKAGNKGRIDSREELVKHLDS